MNGAALTMQKPITVPEAVIIITKSTTQKRLAADHFRGRNTRA